MVRNYFNKLVLVGSLFMMSATGAEAQPAGISTKIQKLVEKLAPSANVSVVDLRTGSTVYSHRANEPVKPASVLKTVTSAVSMSMLGPDYRFKTRFLTDDGNIKGGFIPTLYVEGGGDPSLTTESLIMIARRFRRMGIKEIGRVVVDDSLFSADKIRVGGRAYEAGTSAAAFNFNTLGFDICPTQIGRPARVIPDPHELPVAINGKIVTSGNRRAFYQINDISDPLGGAMAFNIGGEVRRSPECQTIYRSIQQPALYLGASLIGFLLDDRVKVKSKNPSLGRVPQSAHTFLTHSSKPLSQIIWDLNHYSTNVIAEQLVYHLGFSGSSQLSREVGLQRMGTYLERLGYKSTDFDIYDGSGLSHDNRITATIMTSVLVDVYRDREIWPEFESSLAVMGRSGTLRSRMKGIQGGTIRGKTGSLNGVSSLVGYAFSDSGQRYAFASIANGSAVRRAKQLEEELSRMLLLGH
jgi:D-alanyl-D-alanine carboxypeptidase/D-alanyl-D-alanine-endopeptidase (penicillin-binding protein 4)